LDRYGAMENDEVIILLSDIILFIFYFFQ
jgi:hypothetical protein